MGKIAFVFSGQGDQYSGMGKDMAQQYDAAAKIFAVCDKIRPGTSDQCFDGSDQELKETENTQPCLFAVEMAAAQILIEKGITPDAVAGFSLGEVVAMTAAGSADIDTGFRLVIKRGQLMQQAAEKEDTSMAAVIKLTEEQVQEVCSNYDRVYPVNFNCPGQISVAGAADQMKAFAADIKEAGGRALPLKVKGAFHSPFMAGAADAFRKELEDVELKNPEIPLYSNMTGDIYPEELKDTLAEQIRNPVKWEAIIRNMIRAGIDTFIEIGPGQTLTGMIKKIDSTVKTYSTSRMQELLTDLATQ